MKSKIVKRVTAVIMAAALSVTMFTGCDTANGNNNDNKEDKTTSQTEVDNINSDDTENKDSSKMGAITVISREDGSGTRGAFIELFGVEEKDENGNKIDNTIGSAEITNNTAVMMTTVADNINAIGYISLGSLNDTVKALKIDGVEATTENVKSGAYSVSRPFNIATKADVSEVAQDFIDYILSVEGQEVVESKGYISIDTTSTYSATDMTGKIVVAGSSSVTPVMEVLIEAYKDLNPQVDIELQQSDSTTGMNSTIEGVCDIGMASREIKDSELESGLVGTVIAIDGIAVITNNDNTVDNLTNEQVKGIYTGTIKEWSEVL